VLPLATIATSAPAAAGDSWLAWQRASEGGKERWSAQLFWDGDRSASLGIACETAQPLTSGGITALPALLPALTWSQEFSRGIAMQGSVRQTVPASWQAVEALQLQPQYGLCVHLTPAAGACSLPQLQLTCETAARPAGPATNAAPALRWEAAPSLRWQAGTNSWLSGGFLVPLERGRAPDSWQLNWSWQY